MAQTITVTRALAQIKSIDDRLTKAIGLEYVKVVNKSLPENQQISMQQGLKTNYDSVQDLIQLRVKLKTAIKESNVKTLVTINGKQYTVSQAIEFKHAYSQLLHPILKQVEYQLSSAVHSKRTAEVKAEEAVNSMLEKNPNTPTELLNVIRHNNSNTIISWNSLDANETTVRQWSSETLRFLEEVDFVLSESNATTFIEI